MQLNYNQWLMKILLFVDTKKTLFIVIGKYLLKKIKTVIKILITYLIKYMM